MMEGISRALAPIRRKIFLLVGRAILSAVNNSEKTMKIQVIGLKDETITDVESPNDYGFISNPPVDGSTEVTIAFINGNRDQGIALKTHHRDSRPKDLKEGEVRIYDKEENKITLTSNGIEIEDKNGNKVTMGSDGITLDTGDASLFAPNVMKTCPLTGITHGGNVAGILKLKGG